MRLVPPTPETVTGEQLNAMHDHFGPSLKQPVSIIGQEPETGLLLKVTARKQAWIWPDGTIASIQSDGEAS